ncbi:MAG: response regulator transcription factor [Candidatus Rokubacteria bacterium]|nr:response regulator transcription factor [Candidatus Rokubacteria bacterium]
MRVLIVEEQPRSSQLIRRVLEENGHIVEVADGAVAAARRLALDPHAELVILDLMLAAGDGLTVLEMLRRGSAVPVLVVSGRDSVADKVAALDLGADDYLIKPFDFGEFLARVRALSRRRSAGLARP